MKYVMVFYLICYKRVYKQTNNSLFVLDCVWFGSYIVLEKGGGGGLGGLQSP